MAYVLPFLLCFLCSTKFGAQVHTCIIGSTVPSLNKIHEVVTLDDFGVGFSLLTENCLNLGARHAIRGPDITKERFDALDRDSAILVLVGNGEHVLLASGWQFVDVIFPPVGLDDIPELFDSNDP